MMNLDFVRSRRFLHSELLFTKVPSDASTKCRILIAFNTNQHVLVFAHTARGRRFITILLIDVDTSHYNPVLLPRHVLEFKKNGEFLLHFKTKFTPYQFEEMEPFLELLRHEFTVNRADSIPVLEFYVENQITSAFTPFIMSSISLRRRINGYCTSLSITCLSKSHIRIRNGILMMGCGFVPDLTCVDLHKHSCIPPHYQATPTALSHSYPGIRCDIYENENPNDPCAVISKFHCSNRQK
uniref:Uncharacterized protein n=1 Tax=Quibebe spinareovirus TaxID=3078415 RepID=A0AB38Z2F1_9REOV